MPQAGNYPHRVILQAKAVTRSATGAEVIAWTDLATVWASVEDISGREFFAAQKENSEVTTRIRLRQYRAGIRADMRAVWGQTTYDILAALDPTGRKVTLELMARVVT